VTDVPDKSLEGASELVFFISGALKFWADRASEPREPYSKALFASVLVGGVNPQAVTYLETLDSTTAPALESSLLTDSIKEGPCASMLSQA